MPRKRRYAIDIMLPGIFEVVYDEQQRNLMEIAEEEERLRRGEAADQPARGKAPRAWGKPKKRAEAPRKKPKRGKPRQSSSGS